jgi:methionyl-tRNA formyltransferase
VKVVFMGKHKRSAVRALELLVDRGCDVAAVVLPEPDPYTADAQRVDVVAERHGIPLVSDDDLYASLEGHGPVDLEGTDLVLSFLFWKRIRAPLIELPRVGCLNFHPAPLPELRGLGGYNVAILEDFEEYGVSAHFVEQDLDTGDVVAAERFQIDRDAETAWSLDVKSQARLFGLFESVLDRLLRGEELERTPQGEGRYVDRAEFEALRRVPTGETGAPLERRIRAFWYPPHDGAIVERGGEPYTLVDRALLSEIALRYAEGEELP